MEHFVYYIYSQTLDIYYIGKTNNIERRLKEHFNSEELFTKRANDWQLINYIICKDNSAATRLENKLKKAKNKKYVSWFFENHKKYIEES
ncbi:MAG: GIY-YIG nuclease family protein [Patescibacteria group bacterium]